MSGAKPNRFYSKKQEQRTASIIGGRVQPNSGAGVFNKGDVKGEGILLDDKTVTKPQQSVSLRKEWFEKIREEAFSQGLQLSGISFDFGDGNATRREKFFALDEHTFMQLYSAWRQINRSEVDST